MVTFHSHAASQCAVFNLSAVSLLFTTVTQLVLVSHAFVPVMPPFSQPAAGLLFTTVTQLVLVSSAFVPVMPRYRVSCIFDDTESVVSLLL